MPYIISAGTADAPYRLSQSEVKNFVYNLFSDASSDINRLINVFDNSFITERHFSAPVEWFNKEHSFAEKNRIYIDTAIKLSEKAIINCLNKTDIGVSEVDHIYFVSSTGLSTPSIDALLFNKMKFKKNIKRTPIWGLGCAGGAAGLSRAMEYTKAFPGETALLVSVELCSLTFIKNDVSKSNIVATSLFSDGAAAVLIAGKDVHVKSNGGFELLDSLSTTYNDSLDIMGWGIVEEGLRVIFSKDIPSIVRDCVKPEILTLLNNNNLKLEDLNHFVMHPGGAKVLNAYEKALGISSGKLDFSRKILKEHGNMSSPTVLYVLNEFLSRKISGCSNHGLISALGPGFSSELILFRT